MNKRRRQGGGEDEDDSGGHGIRLPGQLLDRIQQNEDKGDYKDQGDRFSKFSITVNKGKKGKPVSRKEQRKEERKVKKQKRSSSNHQVMNSNSHKSSRNMQTTNGNTRDANTASKQNAGKNKAKKTGDDSAETCLRIVREEDLDDYESTEDMDEPANSRKIPTSSPEESGLRIVKESDLDDSFSEFSDEDFGGFDSDVEGSHKNDEDDDDEADPLAKLAALKSKKKAQTFNEDPLAKLAALKAAKNNRPASSTEKFVAALELEKKKISKADPKDVDDPLTALKVLKDTKKKKQRTLNGEEDHENPLAVLKAIKDAKRAKKRAHEIDFPAPSTEERLHDRDDLDMAFYAKKLGLQGGKKASLKKEDDDDEIGGLLEGLDFDFGDSEANMSDQSSVTSDFNSDGSNLEDDFSERKVSENPFVPPVQSLGDASGTVNQNSDSSTTYIPPAVRRKMALESTSNLEDLTALRRSIKGPLNKLSETNFVSIVNEINGLFLNNARHSTNECLTSIILEGIVQQGRLLETFVFLHAAIVAALYRLQGTDFGAYFIQLLVEKFEEYNKNSPSSKEASNLVSLLSSLYQFSFISARLLYDIIRSLLQNLNETNADLLLRLIRDSGNQMRSDDPNALKDIVLMLNDIYSSLDATQKTTRTQFLVETISSLKNNKLKANSEGNYQLIIRLKKALGTVRSSKSSDPIQVSLDDIRNVESRGKWWLVGSAWKGQQVTTLDAQNDVNEIAVNDVLENSEPNWMELARSRRMNTDIRRAIFISIMSAGDYIDAVTKLDKLALKRAQEREIPKILIHCTTIEPAWNPYYGVLGHKLCDNHNHRKTFQFMLWDLIKELDGSSDQINDSEEMFIDNADEDENAKIKRILNLGRFFGFLVAQGSLPLHVLRTVNLLAASPDTNLFLEALFIAFLDQIGRKSKVSAVGGGLSKKMARMHEQKFDDKRIIEIVAKSRKEAVLLRGVQHFLQEKVIGSALVTNSAQASRVSWGVEAFRDLVDEIEDKEK